MPRYSKRKIEKLRSDIRFKMTYTVTSCVALAIEDKWFMEHVTSVGKEVVVRPKQSRVLVEHATGVRNSWCRQSSPLSSMPTSMLIASTMPIRAFGRLTKEQKSDILVLDYRSTTLAKMVATLHCGLCDGTLLEGKSNSSL